MKKLVALTLTLLMLASVFGACGKSVTTAGNTETTSDGNEKSTSETTTPEYEDIYVDDDDRSDVPVIVEHKMLPEEELPSSFSLIGTIHLPPIDNQGSLGTCASQGITYTQLTNAVSRYLHSKDPDIKWDPSSGDEKTIFAPKFTYNFSGSGTAWVYNIIKDHGALTLNRCKFASNNGYKYGDRPNNREKQTISWPTKSGDMEKALNYRISDYEQIWLRTVSDKLTTSDEGKELLYKIKDAVVQGNVVVTGGFSSNWRYLSQSDIKKSGLRADNDMVAVWCNGTGGGHQVSIVGYDDDFTCIFDGVEMKGAFKVANSWGNWGDNGYFWVMYDAVNKVSAYEELNNKEKYQNRTVALDQFCFIYWEKDIVVEMPQAYVTLKLSTKNREGFYVELSRTDSTDTAKTYIPYLFTYGDNFEGIHSHSFFKDGESTVTFGGTVDATTAETGYMTFGYNTLTESACSFEDFLWGLNLTVTDGPVTIEKISLYDGDGKLRAEIVPPEESKTVSMGTVSFVFDAGSDPKSNHDVGSYKFKNSASGLYISSHPDSALRISSDSNPLNATEFEVQFDLVNRNHVIHLGGKQYILDIRDKTIADGVEVKFNAYNKRRNTQTWKVVQLEDGSYNIRLAAETRYALGMVDGKPVLVSGVGIRDYGNWILEKAGNENMTVTVRYDGDGKLMAEGRIPTADKEESITVTAYSSSGEKVSSWEVQGEGELRTLSYELTGLKAGTYCFTFTDSKGKEVSASYIALVK